MKVLIINSVCGIRSTGRICTDLAKKFEQQEHMVKIAYGRESVPEEYQKYAIRIGNNMDNKLSAVHTRLTDMHGFANVRATREFLKWVECYNPDLIWLHNLHGYYINVEMLFDWIKLHPDTKVKWTLHDCWAFTGHCSHFTMVKCEQWKTKCLGCAQKRRYPTSLLIDSCKYNFERKKATFTGVKNMTLITPSKWLANLVKQSFLNEYPIEVVYNTVDTDVFKPTTSNFRERFGLQNRKIILGVASAWGERKGLADFIKLSKMLDDRYVIVLVGLTEKQIRGIPKKIISIARTNSSKELAEIYTVADVFFNPTYEDNYPTVNLEAQACGTPVVTYRTGGSVESVPENNVIDVGDLEMFVKIISKL